MINTILEPDRQKKLKKIIKKLEKLSLQELAIFDFFFQRVIQTKNSKKKTIHDKN